MLELPMRGHLLVQNSPANRVPSHGTDLFATTFAIDLVPVADRGRSAMRTVESWVRAEPPERFVGFGRPVLAPVAGRVAVVHDGEADRQAVRAPFAALAFAATQARRVRAGAAGLAGNHVVIEAGGRFVLLAHLRLGSIRVASGEWVDAGAPIGACGNSGNSTEPHVHLQVMDGPDGARARGLPFAFRGPNGHTGLPRNGEVVGSG